MRDSSIVHSDDIKFACSQCGQRIVVERSAAGLAGTCPVCNNPVTIPQESHVEAEEPSQQASSRDEARWQEMSAEEARVEIARQHSLFRKAVEECERLNANTTHVQAESKRFQADRQQLKADLAQARQVAAAAEARAGEVGEALVAAHHENAALREQIEGELVVLREQLAATGTQLAVREDELRAGQVENSQVVQALAQAQADLASLTAEAAGLRTEGAAYRQDAETTTQHLASTAQLLQETQAQLQSTTEAHTQSSQERDEWRQKAEIWRQDLSSIDSGRELLELRENLAQLQQTHRTTETTLTQRTAEAAASAATVETLRADLQESRRLHADAERRAEAGSESQLKKDNDVLRGIVDRQNATLATHHGELRHLRRGRYLLRLVYALFALGLLTLGYFAFKVIDPQDFARVFNRQEFSRLFRH